MSKIFKNWHVFAVTAGYLIGHGLFQFTREPVTSFVIIVIGVFLLGCGINVGTEKAR